MKLIHGCGMLRGNITEAHVFPDHRSVLRFHQTVVSGAIRP